MRTFSTVVPAAVLTLFALVLPVSLPRAASPISDEACLALGDAPIPTTVSTPTLERCAALYPDDVEVLEEIGRRAETAGRLDDAIAQYRRIVSIDPDAADVRLRLGRLLLDSGAAADALREAQRALDVQPNRRALLDLANAARRQLVAASH